MLRKYLKYKYKEGHKAKLPQISLQVVILTIIQQYLPTNFVYTRFALTSKRIRYALNASGLRNGRDLTIHVPLTKSSIPFSSVLKMVQFSEFITIKIKNIATVLHKEQILNIETLSKCLIQILVGEQETISTQYSLSIENSYVLTILFIRQDEKATAKLKEFPQIRMKYFFAFLDLVEKLNSLTLSFFNLYYYDKPQLVILQGIEQANELVKFNSILQKTKKSIQSLKFCNYNFYGNFPTHFSELYSSVETLIYTDCAFLTIGQFGNYQNVKQLTVLDCSIYRDTAENIDFKVKEWVCKDVTIDVLINIIKGQSPTSKLQSLDTLEADINTGDSLMPDSNQPWQIITAIRNCTLRDQQTQFSFSMISKLLQSTITFDNASSFPPILLQISKFFEIEQSKQICDQSIENGIKILAEQKGLRVLRFEEVITKQNDHVYIIELQLNHNSSRRLILKTIN